MSFNSQEVTPPVGLATKVGLISSAIAGVAAGAAAVAGGDHSNETLGALVTAGIILYGVIRSRGEQAAVLLAKQPPAPAKEPGADVPKTY